MIGKIFNVFIVSVSLMLVISLSSCRFNNKKSSSITNTQDSLSFVVERAPQWTAVFKRDSGWFGGDGIFSIPYSGKDRGEVSDSILFLFSDTMVGEIDKDSLKSGYTMVHNSIALYNKKKTLNTVLFKVANNEQDKPTSIFVPQNKNSKKNKEYYWLGDGFINKSENSKLYIFAYRIKDLENKKVPFPFKQIGNDLLVIAKGSKFPFLHQKQLKIPFNKTLDDSLKVSFGSGILVNTKDAGENNADGYIYIYGTRSKNNNEVVCARVKPTELEKFNEWKFWDGKKWTNKSENIAPLSNYVSNELSVTSLPNGEYGLIYQYGGIYPKIYMQTSTTPEGPFGKRIELWDTSNDITDPDLYTYNAKAHPAISKPGELLVSYNVNSFKFFDIIEDKPHLYHPRFIKIKFNINNN